MWLLVSKVLKVQLTSLLSPHKHISLCVIFKIASEITVYIISLLQATYSTQHVRILQAYLPCYYCHIYCQSLSRVRLFAIPWTVACQVPLSMAFNREEYWSGLPFPSPEDLPNPGIKPRSPILQAKSLPSVPPGKCHIYHMYINYTPHSIALIFPYTLYLSNYLLVLITSRLSCRSSGISLYPERNYSHSFLPSLSLMRNQHHLHCYLLVCNVLLLSTSGQFFISVIRISVLEL